MKANTMYIISQTYACNACHAPVAIMEMDGGALYYTCTNEQCGRCFEAHAPQGLGKLEDATLAQGATMDWAIEVAA